MGYAGYTASLIASIHYAAPVVSVCMKWGTDMKKVAAAFIGFIAINFLTTYYVDGDWLDVGTSNGWWALMFAQLSESETNMFGLQWTQCGSEWSDIWCLTSQF